jgi:formiminoglutamase
MKEISNFFDSFSLNHSIYKNSQLYSNVINLQKNENIPSDINTIALINFSINNDREKFITSLIKLRSYLYSYSNIDKVQILDCGSFINSVNAKDSIDGLAYVLSDLITTGIVPIIISDDRSVILAIHKAYEHIKRYYNLDFILPFIDINNENLWEKSKDLLPWHDYIFRNNLLLNTATFIGYQSYLTDGDALQWVENNFFDLLRLGDIRENIKSAEPYIRNSDIICIDMNVMKKSEAPATMLALPNGLYAEELCQLSYYAGMSDKSSVFTFYNYNPDKDLEDQTMQLIAQALWYIAEGVSLRVKDYPFTPKTQMLKYTVIMDSPVNELIFYRSTRSDRWWIELPIKNTTHIQRHTLIPCLYEDYLAALQNKIPLIFWNAIKKKA